MLDEHYDRDTFLVEGAAYTVVALMRQPMLFWLKFWEAAWTTG